MMEMRFELLFGWYFSALLYLSNGSSSHQSPLRTLWDAATLTEKPDSVGIENNNQIRQLP